jgi:hypothetical protein
MKLYKGTLYFFSIDVKCNLVQPLTFTDFLFFLEIPPFHRFVMPGLMVVVKGSIQKHFVRFFIIRLILIFIFQGYTNAYFSVMVWSFSLLLFYQL